MFQAYWQAGAQFVCCLMLQILIWQVCVRSQGSVPRQMLLLFALFLGGPLVHFALEPDWTRLTLALGLGCAYVMTFPAVSAKSPTIVIIDLLDREGEMAEADIRRKLEARAALVEDRVRDLKSDGLACEDGGRLKPSRAGRILGMTFLYYRRALGLPIGKG
jgi:hypothetical protein